MQHVYTMLFTQTLKTEIPSRSVSSNGLTFCNWKTLWPKETIPIFSANARKRSFLWLGTCRQMIHFVNCQRPGNDPVCDSANAGKWSFCELQNARKRPILWLGKCRQTIHFVNCQMPGNDPLCDSANARKWFIMCLSKMAGSDPFCDSTKCPQKLHFAFRRILGDATLGFLESYVL